MNRSSEDKKRRKNAKALLLDLRKKQDSKPDLDSAIDWQDSEDGMQLLLDLFRAAHGNISDEQACDVLELLRAEHGLDENYDGCILNVVSSGSVQEWDAVAFAGLFGNARCAFWLMDHCDGDPCVEGYWGTPLIFMLSAHHIEELLLRGERVEVRDEEAQTLLHHVASAPFFDEAVAQRLLDAGLSLQDVDQNGNTPLHKAAKKGNAPFVRWALKNGADVMKLHKQKTVADLAAGAGHKALASELQAKIVAHTEQTALEVHEEISKKTQATIGRLVLQLAKEGRLRIDGEVVSQDALSEQALSTKTKSEAKKAKKTRL